MELRYYSAQEDLTVFLSQFASVRLTPRKERWRLERLWHDTFIGDVDAPNPAKGGLRGLYYLAANAVARLEDGAAEESYCARQASAYVLIPELPETVAFECLGRLPPLQAWRDFVGHDLPSCLVVMDSLATWTFVMSPSQPEMGPYFLPIDLERSGA